MAPREQVSETGSEQDRSPLACYANYFEVGHNAFEFLIDLGQIEPRSGRFQLQTRFAVGPTHAKILARLLENAVTRFESEHGAIPDIAEAAGFDALLDPPPDFERRAIDARRRASNSDEIGESGTPAKTSSRKSNSKQKR